MITHALITQAVAIAEKRSKRPGASVYSGRATVMIERALYAAKSSNWLIIISGFVEPVLYLMAFGFGIGQLIGDIQDGSGNPVSYAAYIAPALLATSAMNGALYDATWNVFFKMHFGKIYQVMLSSSLGPMDVALGEISWALLRGAAYSIGFMAIVTPLGLVTSAWGLLAIPAATLIAFGFASVGMAITSYMKNFQQMNWINFFLLPMFLFSGTFFPVSVYPDWIEVIVKALPLWQGVDLVRSLMLGVIDLSVLGHIAYFVVMIALGLSFTTVRLKALFMR
ncbi:MAG: ABC transporter permease [Aquiluna sp.]|jgi:lipooligosaccharide transport system permease protein|nr:ABC transporter permease [Aquiluna sp.]